MHFDVFVFNQNGKMVSDVSLASHKSLDFVIDKFLKEASERIKKEKLTIPTAFAKYQFVILDSDNTPHGTIIGAHNDNHPKGLFVVSLPNRQTVRLYNLELRMVGRKSL